MATEQDYIHMLKNFFENETPRMKETNHAVHNSNPEYWSRLLGPLKDGDWSEKTTLDFGCGCGRNVINILENFKVKEAHGCDISSNNVIACRELAANKGFSNAKFETNEAKSIPSEDNVYDFVMSTVVLQHIPCYTIRKAILTDMYRVMKDGGVLSFQMGYGPGHPNAAGYYANVYDAPSTNSAYDTQVTDPQQLIGDLSEIGFKNIETTISSSWSDWHRQWIFVKCAK